MAALRFNSSAFGEFELERLNQRLGEIVPPDGDRTHPHVFRLGNNQVAVLGADVDDHRGAAFEAVVIMQAVIDGQGVHLNHIHFQADVGKILDGLVDQLAPHRKNSDFHFRRIGRLEKVITPFHQSSSGKRNLLDGSRI